MSVNKVILIGRLGSDPEVRYTQSGSPVANFTLATSDGWTDQQGQKQEKTEWHKVVVFGRQAETCKQYLSKGRQVYLEGKLETSQWTDQQGQNRYTTKVNARDVRFLGSRDNAGSSAGGGQSNDGSSQDAPAPAQGGGWSQPAAPAPYNAPKAGGPQGGAPQGGAPQGGAPQGGAPQGGAPQGGAPQGGGGFNDDDIPF